MTNDLAFPIGQKFTLPGYFDVPVTLEDARMPRGGLECRFRLPHGSLEKAVISFGGAASLAKSFQLSTISVHPANTEEIRLLVESARVRLAYTHDHQFAVSTSGIRTFSNRIEAVFRDKIQKCQSERMRESWPSQNWI